MPEGLIEPAAHVRTKAPHERRARHRGELPDALDTEPAKGVDGLDREAKRPERQLGDGRCHSAGDDDALWRMPGDRPSCSWRVGDGGAGIYARPPQAPCEVVQQRLFPAEEMGRPGDLDPNAIRAVRRHKWAVA